MKRVFGILLIVCVVAPLFSAHVRTNSDPYFDSLMKELEGVYQIQMVNSRMKPMISTELLELIKEKQSPVEQVSFFYRETIRVVIKSKQDVDAGNKFTEDEYIIYVSE